jgi:prepilin-type N-terminal cleavage/methylation domain-containing protein
MNLSHPTTRSAATARRLHSAGFTLIELIATIVVIGTVGSVASLMVSSSVNGYVGASVQAQLHAELSVTLDRIDRELKRIPSEGSGAISPDIVSITPTLIQWTGNYRFHLSLGKLYYTDGGGTARILQEDVTAFNVQAFDQNNAAMSGTLNDAACDAVRRVQITVTVQRSGVTETLRSKFFLRCTMEGVLV